MNNDIVNAYMAESTIQYVLGYIAGIQSVLPVNRRQFGIGFSNATKDIEEGVIRLHDLELAKHITTLIGLGVLPLEIKPSW